MKTILCLLALAFTVHAASKPNVVLILIDDFGYECVTANGGESYKTPVMDKLAATGVRFEQVHVQPLCTPTRAALMTGTTMEPPDVIASAWPQLGNRPMSEAIHKNFALVGLPKWSEEEVAFAKEFQKANRRPEVGLATTLPPPVSRSQSFSSNDIGDLTWNVPFGLMTYPGSVPGINYHAWQAAVTPTSSFTHKGMVAGAKVMAVWVVDKTKPLATPAK
mgnify:CR=1 FL=1